MNLNELNNIWVEISEDFINKRVEQISIREKKECEQAREDIARHEKELGSVQGEIANYRATRPRSPRPVRNQEILTELKKFCIDEFGEREADRLEKEDWPAPSKADFCCVSHRQRNEYTELRVKALGLEPVYAHNQYIRIEWQPGLDTLLEKEKSILDRISRLQAEIRPSSRNIKASVIRDIEFKEMDFRDQHKERYDFNLCGNDERARKLFHSLLSHGVHFTYSEAVDWHASWGLLGSSTGFMHKIYYWATIENGPGLMFEGTYCEEVDFDDEDDED